MTAIDIDTARKVARLARLGVPEERLALYASQLSNIIKFVEQLNEIPTDDVAPLANVVEIPLRLREDTVTDGERAADILSNAPEAVEGFIVVPKVVE